MKDIHKKLSVISIGFFANSTINFLFDYVLYPGALLYWGTAMGGLIMTCVSIILNFTLIIIYSINDIDWFGFEEIRLKKDEKNEKKLFNVILRLGYWPAFVLLAFYDPFLAFVYARGKRKSHKHFSLFDWLIFIVAHIIGNGGWIILLTGVITLVKGLIYNYL